jgi:hypothetical protein
MGAGPVHRLTAAMFATVLSGAIVLVAASPAQAVPGLTSITGIGAIDSSTTKTVTATCPVGDDGCRRGRVRLRVARPGVSHRSASGRVHLRHWLSGLTTEDESGYAQPWTPVAVAICAN